MHKVYLHMGFPKTASTSFQATCAENITRLEDQGYIYPLFNCLQNQKVNPVINHSIPLYSSFSPYPSHYHINIKWRIENITLVNASYRDQLAQYLVQDKDLIISGEDIVKLNITSLNKLIAFISINKVEIIPVVLVRSPYAFHCSSCQETVKWGRHANFTDFRSQRDRILTIKKAFKDKVAFFPFRRACEHFAGPVGFLLEYLGVNINDFSFVNRNEGVANEQVRFQNILNKYQPSFINKKSNSDHRKVRKAKGNKFYLTENELSVIRRDLDEENLFFERNLGLEFCDKGYETSDEFNIDDLISHYPEIFFSKLGNLSDQTIDYLRDIAIKEEESNLGLAHELMSLAHEARPSGEFIKLKLESYRKKLASTEGDICIENADSKKSRGLI